MRAFPRNIASEQILLGKMLMNPKGVVPKVRSQLTPQDFYSIRHCLICQAIFETQNHEPEIKVDLVAQRLRELNKLEGVGGRDYLVELKAGPWTSAAFSHYVKIILGLEPTAEVYGRMYEWD